MYEMSRSTLMKTAPSVFADGQHESCSSRYTHIPTIHIIEALDTEGWKPVQALQSRARILDRKNHTKHSVRFRHVSHLDAREMGVVPEIILFNSHDGSSSYQIHAGIYRFLCCNGLIIADATLGHQRIRHSGDVVSQVIEGVYSIMEDLPALPEKIERMKSVQLDGQEQIAFAKAAMHVRWDDPEHCGFSPHQVIASRRQEDEGSDLWRTFNRAQENLTRGGLHGRQIGRDGRARRTTTRPVKAPAEDLRINKALWALVEEMAVIKSR